MTQQETAVQHRKIRFGGLRAKVILGFTLVFTLVFAGAFLWFYEFATQRAIEQLEEDLRGTLNGAVHLLNGDDLQALIEAGVGDGESYPDDPRYWAHVQNLYTVHLLEPRAFPYSFYAGPGPDQVTYIGSVGAAPAFPGSPVGVKLGEVCTNGDGCNLDDNLVTLGQEVTTVDTGIYSDDWGSWISGYAPFYNSAGELVGALGVDFEASYVLQVQQSIVHSMALVFLLTYGVLLVLVYLVSGSLTKPMRRFTGIASRIGEGDYSVVHELKLLQRGLWNDEINTLAVVFEEMTGKIDRRETELKQQVRELKIEIDEARAQQQVEEIVDTDFFDRLSEKAREIRQRKNNNLGPQPA